MTQEEFYTKVHEYGLENFDALIEIQLNKGEKHQVIWLSTMPALNPSVDNKFKGKQETEVFYSIDTGDFIHLEVRDIEKIMLLQKNYLQVPNQRGSSSSNSVKQSATATVLGKTAFAFGRNSSRIKNTFKFLLIAGLIVLALYGAMEVFDISIQIK